jgi:translation initiation factor IF-1
VVVELLPAQQFRVELAGGGQVVAHLAPARSRRFVRLRLRDRVRVELTARDPVRGRIVEVINRGL